MSKRNTKIVATIGPASQDEQTILRLVEAGIDIARLNFSHGSYKEYEQIIARLRKAAQIEAGPVCILQDLQGPKIRTGSLPQGEVVACAAGISFKSSACSALGIWRKA